MVRVQLTVVYFPLFAADDHLINHAPRGQLHRVRKAELFRLWRVAGLADEKLKESDTHKNELVDGLIEAVSILPFTNGRFKMSFVPARRPISFASV